MACRHMKKDVVLTQAGWRCKCGEIRGDKLKLTLRSEIPNLDPLDLDSEVEMIEFSETFDFEVEKK
jgi:hypothetical protein